MFLATISQQLPMFYWLIKHNQKYITNFCCRGQFSYKMPEGRYECSKSDGFDSAEKIHDFLPQPERYYLGQWLTGLAHHCWSLVIDE